MASQYHFDMAMLPSGLWAFLLRGECLPARLSETTFVDQAVQGRNMCRAYFATAPDNRGTQLEPLCYEQCVLIGVEVISRFEDIRYAPGFQCINGGKPIGIGAERPSRLRQDGERL